MALLKEDGTTPTKKPPSLSVHNWPVERLPEGLGVSFKDGWNFGTGFGLAMLIAVPLILLCLACIIGIGVIFLGGSLGVML